MRRGYHDSHLIWCGSVFTEAAVSANFAISPAANRWQYGFLTSLQKLGLKVHTIGHMPEPLWPKGRFLVRGNSEILNPAIKGSLNSYCNLMKWREIWLARTYLKAFQRYCKKNGNPVVIITYNDSPVFSLVTQYAQKELNIPWICIVADNVAPQTADGLVFLSWGYYNRYHHCVKLHLDGGIRHLQFDHEPCSEKKSEIRKIVLYSGMMSVWGGVNFLLKAFERIHDPDVELWICGHGRNSDLEAALKRDSRIRFFGFVSESRLQEMCKQASVFVNPRPSHVPGNTMNFPSKILEYLSYGKAVVSTWTPGLGPEYRDVLEVLNEETENCLAKTIEDVLHWSDQKVKCNSLKIKSFLLKEKTWTHQARRLINWLEDEIL